MAINSMPFGGIPTLGGSPSDGLFTKALTPSQGGTDLSLSDAILNMVTGNADYMRTLETIDIQNAFSAREAQKSRDWQEYMRDSSVESMVNQFKENGLNPYLAYNSASVSTPPSTSAHSVTGNYFSSGKGFITLLLGLLSSAVNISKIREMSDLNAAKAGYFESLIKYNEAKADYWNSLYDRFNRK